MKVLLAGEGQTDLGDWCDRAPRRSARPEPGVIEALARKQASGEWTIEDAVLWKDIRKYKTGGHRSREMRNVLGVVLAAHERRLGVAVFVRDGDGDTSRMQDVESGIEQAAEVFPTVRIAGGIAARRIEAWVLAVMGVRGSEEIADPKGILEGRGVQTRADKVRVIDQSGLTGIPPDAASLRRWLERVGKALPSAGRPPGAVEGRTGGGPAV